MPADSGMLFVFDREDIYPFWMKNTLISLDIVWMNSYRQVVYISKNTPSCVTEICPDINPSGNAKYVLEVNGGVADKISLKIGDYLSF